MRQIKHFGEKNENMEMVKAVEFQNVAAPLNRGRVKVRSVLEDDKGFSDCKGIFPSYRELFQHFLFQKRALPALHDARKKRGGWGEEGHFSFCCSLEPLPPTDESLCCVSTCALSPFSHFYRGKLLPFKKK